MRRITLWLVSTISALVLLFSYRTSTMGVGGATAAAEPGGAVAGSGSTDPGSSSGGTSSGGSSSGGTSSGGTSSGGSSSGGSAKNGSFEGSVAQTRWGPVQVRITVSGGKITEVTALQVPSGNFRDQQINDYAVPMLRQEVLQAQSAQIDAISGATVTSDGYRESLQAAVDAAHLR